MYAEPVSEEDYKVVHEAKKKMKQAATAVAGAMPALEKAAASGNATKIKDAVAPAKRAIAAASKAATAAATIAAKKGEHRIATIAHKTMEKLQNADSAVSEVKKVTEATTEGKAPSHVKYAAERAVESAVEARLVAGAYNLKADIH